MKLNPNKELGVQKSNQTTKDSGMQMSMVMSRQGDA